MNEKLRKIGQALIAPVAALLFALAIASIALIIVGVNPLFAFSEMIQYSWSTESLISILNRAAPLYVSAVAVAVGFKMGLFNIGVEGQYLLAGLFAAYVGSQFSVWGPLHITIMLVIAIAIGALWGGIAGVLKSTRGVHEVISTIMLNFIAINLVAYFLKTYFRADETSLNISTPILPLSGRFPSLNGFLELIGLNPPSGFDLRGFLLVAVIVGVFYYMLVWRTRFGFELRASGINPGSALFAGVNPKRMVVYTMLISGGIAGLVGMGHVTGFFYAYTQDFPRMLGFNGIAVALLGRNNPVGMAVGALLFAFIDRASLVLDLRGIPREINQIIAGVVVLAVVIAYEVVERRLRAAETKAAAEATADTKPEMEAAA